MEKVDMAGETAGKRRGFSLLRFALALFAIAIAHFATAVAFGHSTTDALETLASDTVMLIVVLLLAVCVRSRMRRKAQGTRS
jgi:uncharacterized membrane protein YdjX (TVP38/TMEM64 family)